MAVLFRQVEGSAGKICAGFRIANGVCPLTVDDDGSPLPDNLFTNVPPTMGVRRVLALKAQLMGEQRMGSDPKFRITFPASAPGPRIAVSTTNAGTLRG